MLWHSGMEFPTFFADPFVSRTRTRDSRRAKKNGIPVKICRYTLFQLSTTHYNKGMLIRKHCFVIY